MCDAATFLRDTQQTKEAPPSIKEHCKLCLDHDCCRMLLTSAAAGAAELLGFSQPGLSG
jgi:hypothetical protein